MIFWKSVIGVALAVQAIGVPAAEEGTARHRDSFSVQARELVGGPPENPQPRFSAIIQFDLQTPQNRSASRPVVTLSRGALKPETVPTLVSPDNRHCIFALSNYKDGKPAPPETSQLTASFRVREAASATSETRTTTIRVPVWFYGEGGLTVGPTPAPVGKRHPLAVAGPFASHGPLIRLNGASPVRIEVGQKDICLPLCLCFELTTRAVDSKEVPLVRYLKSKKSLGSFTFFGPDKDGKGVAYGISWQPSSNEGKMVAGPARLDFDFLIRAGGRTKTITTHILAEVAPDGCVTLLRSNQRRRAQHQHTPPYYYGRWRKIPVETLL